MGMPVGLSVSYLERKRKWKKERKISRPMIVAANITLPEEPLSPNPNPYKFEILDIFEKNNYTVVKVNYIGCTNFEGIKILVFEGNVKTEILKLNALDPHFMENGKFTLLARFRPDNKGWKVLNQLLKDNIN